MIKIDYLKNYPNSISALAQIWHEVLGKIWVPEISTIQVEEKFRNHLHVDQLPLTLVALSGDEPVGMCSLRINDGIRPDLTPWLGSLVVSPTYQKQGIARMLIDKTKEKASQIGFSTLYLFALDPTIPDYYQRLGWEKISMDKFKGYDVTVMQIKL